MSVDAAVLPAGWAGWDASSEGHILAPLDVVRRSDGHDVLLPVCPDRLSDALARVGNARSHLTAGEAVTLVVSLLRGLDELGADAAHIHGEWWLTDAGRPVLAIGTGGATVGETSAAILRLTAAVSGLRGPWDDIRAAIESGPLSSREIARLEERVFAIGRPEPFSGATPTPRSSASFGALLTDAARARAAEASQEPEGRPSWIAWVLRHVDTDLAEFWSRLSTDIWRRARGPRPESSATEASARQQDGPRRGRIWLVAGAISIAVIGVGVLWPAGDGAPDVAAAPRSASAVTTADPTPSAEADPVTSDASESTEQTPEETRAQPDLATITTELLTARTACGGEEECLDAVTVDPGRGIDAGAVDLPPDQREVVLLDDFGGVAVLRVSARDDSSVAQLVVIQNETDQWLLREVYPAQQP